MATVFSRENRLQLGWDIPQYYTEGTALGEGGRNHLSRKGAPGSKLLEREEGVKKKKKSQLLLTCRQDSEAEANRQT